MNRTRPSLFKRPAAAWLAGTMMGACAIMLCADSLRSDESGFANRTTSRQSSAERGASAPGAVGRAAISAVRAAPAALSDSPPGRASIADAWLAGPGIVEIGPATSILLGERPT